MLIVFEKFVSVVGDRLAVIFLEQLRVNFLLRGFELCAHIILFANENELSRSRVIFVFQEIMHAQPEIFQAEFAKVFPTDRERIKIVLFQISSKLSSPFLVLPPEKTCRQKEQRHNDRCNNVDGKFALQRVDHERVIISQIKDFQSGWTE